MKTLLLVLAVLAFISGFGILGSAKSAIHEIEAFVLYIVSAVLFSGSAIVGAVNRLTDKLEKASPVENSYAIECPHCSAKVKLSEIPYENQVIVCPECQKRFAAHL